MSEGDPAPAEGAAFRDHFSTRSAEYAATRPVYPPELVEWLGRLPARRDVAWDAGCGTGQLSVPLAAVFARVVATDASEAQLAHAAPHERVEYRHVRVESSGLPPDSVDLVVAAQAAHWFDLPAFYAEARRVGRAGSAIVLMTYGVLEGDEAIDPHIRHLHYDVLQPHWPRERLHVERRYADLPFPFEPLPGPSLTELRVEWPLERLLGYMETWSATRAYERAAGRAEIDAFRAAVTQAWGDVPLRPLRWPLTVRAGRLR